MYIYTDVHVCNEICFQDVVLRKHVAKVSSGGNPYQYSNLVQPSESLAQITFDTIKSIRKIQFEAKCSELDFTQVDSKQQLNDLVSNKEIDQRSQRFAISSEYLSNLMFLKKKNSKSAKLKSRPRNDLDKYKTMQLFETTRSDYSSTFFIGAPVSCVEWLPDLLDDECDECQYLSVVGNKWEHSLDASVVYDELSVLQIWNCGVLPLKPKNLKKVF